MMHTGDPNLPEEDRESGIPDLSAMDIGRKDLAAIRPLLFLDQETYMLQARLDDDGEARDVTSPPNSPIRLGLSFASLYQ